MNSKQLRLFGSIMPVMYGVIMLAYGILWFAAMGSAQMNDDTILTAVRAPWWIPLSVLGYAGVLAGIPAFASFYLSHRDRAGRTGFLGALFMVWALVIQGSSVSWEIAIYPLLAKLNPEIISSGVIYQNPVSGSIYLALLVFMISGSIMTGISLFRSGNVSKISALGITIFGALYSVVVMVPPAIGAPVMVLYTLSVISAGISMLRHYTRD